MSDHSPKHPTAPNANERWKSRGRLRAITSMTIAAALHAAVFVIWRVPEITNPIADTPMGSVRVVQLDRSAAGGSVTRGTAVPIPAAPVPATTEEEEEGAGGDEDDGDGEETERVIAGSSESLFEQIRERGPNPRVVEREPEPDPQLTEESSSDNGEDLTAASGDPTTAESMESMNLSAVDLDRLSAVRPKVVLTAPSGWVLVRNRSEVRRFLNWAYRQGDVARGATGTVSVALWIDEEGAVDWAEITDSSGRDDLDRLALELFQDVVDFVPARNEGTPVGTSAIFTLVFPWP